MLIRELTTPECHDVLKRASIARLGCARDNQAYVVPVHVYFDENYLYSFAMLGQKIAWMRENPRVCVQVDEIVDPTQWATVIAFGTYEELLHMPSQEAERQRAKELFQRAPDWWQPGASNPNRELRMAVVYRIRIESLTGRLAERQQERPVERPWWLDVLFEKSK
ncbi:MAG TPA: pyridoxamine 5'-phosphate oxidase family protein [Vicinamibacterales bacterium]|jgi:nitroimidazol reductase NimA-like FMN-containing flavoprotein (pyridoxamine 5'-phosphate oxidase superfamily)|nr:pyridoxamine 5'-phosphate oxidase family protein [Vicinamibacterales bacterium]